MIDTQALKKKVLSAAIKGELTSKPSEYERWEWKPLGQIARIYNGRAYKQAELLKNKDGNTPVLRVGNLFTNNDWYYSDLQLEENKYCDNGDLIYAWSASFGPFIWDGGKAIYHYHIWKIEHDERIDRRFLYYFLMSDTQELKEAAHGVAMVHVTKARMEKTMVPLPTLQAQKLIVKKIDDAFEQLDMIEMLQLQYSNNIASLNNKILDLAIRGKLVPQDQNDEPASVLLKKIAEEKQKLIKEGKIKKQKALPAITEDEIPFDIPESWEWCYVNDIAFVTKLAGFEYTKNIAPNLQSEGIPLFKGKNVQNGKLVTEFESFIPENVSDELPRSQLNRKCLLTPYVGTIGNIAIFDGTFRAHLGSNVGKIEILNYSETYVTEEYVLYYLRSPEGYRQLTKYKKATAQESISIDAIRNVIIAIPPLEEQVRIVANIEKAFEMTETIK